MFRHRKSLASSRCKSEKLKKWTRRAREENQAQFEASTPMRTIRIRIRSLCSITPTKATNPKESGKCRRSRGGVNEMQKMYVTAFSCSHRSSPKEHIFLFPKTDSFLGRSLRVFGHGHLMAWRRGCIWLIMNGMCFISLCVSLMFLYFLDVVKQCFGEISAPPRRFSFRSVLYPFLFVFVN